MISKFPQLKVKEPIKKVAKTPVVAAEKLCHQFDLQHAEHSRFVVESLIFFDATWHLIQIAHGELWIFVGGYAIAVYLSKRKLPTMEDLTSKFKK